MSGFNYSSRRAIDPREPLAIRYVMFVQACSAFRGLCGFPVTMQRVHDTLGEAFGFSQQMKPNPDQITLSISAMIAARFKLLHSLHEAARLRYRRKLAGDRRKVPRPYTPQQALDALRAAARVTSGK